MSLADKHPNLLSVLILTGILLLAIGYGIATYRGQPGRKSFNVDESYRLPYDLKDPAQLLTLPEVLTEISGLAFYRDSKVFTIQDESGVLYLFDLDGQQIERTIEFGKDRDYEGVAYTGGEDVYVLEKDGDLHHVSRLDTNVVEADKMETLFSYRNDTEGVCYDERTRRLLIVPKETELESQQQSENQRGIYAFDLPTGRLLDDPVYTIDEYELGQIVYGKRKRYLFKPSGIAIEPSTGYIYLIASVGKVLVVINRNSEILHVELLERKFFRQPEGITFTDKEELLISSEGSGRKPTLARFARMAFPDPVSKSDNNE